VDFVETLEAIAEQGALYAENDFEVNLAQTLQNNKTLAINNLTTSSWSSMRSTNQKKNMDGCTERLIELAGRGFNIPVDAAH
jgi:hypothetical protein